MKQYLKPILFMSSVIAMGPLVLALPAHAQMEPGMTGHQKGMPMSGAQQMSTMTHDMSDRVMGMAGEMSNGNMNAMQQKQMGERMRMMASMMDDMSGMMGQGKMGPGGMMPPDMQKKMDQMRKQMEGMSSGSMPMNK